MASGTVKNQVAHWDGLVEPVRAEHAWVPWAGKGEQSFCRGKGAQRSSSEGGRSQKRVGLISAGVKKKQNNNTKTWKECSCPNLQCWVLPELFLLPGDHSLKLQLSQGRRAV